MRPTSPFDSRTPGTHGELDADSQYFDERLLVGIHTDGWLRSGRLADDEYAAVTLMAPGLAASPQRRGM